MTSVSRLKFRGDVNAAIRWGLLICIWFSALSRAAHDQWAACVVFALLSALCLLYLAGQTLRPEPVCLPLWKPVLFLLVISAISLPASYDFASTRLDLWIMLFCFVGFYLFVNATPASEDIGVFFRRASLILIPLAVITLHQQITGAPDSKIGHITFLGWTSTYRHWEIAGTLINSVVLSGFVLYWSFVMLEARKASPLQWILWLAFLIILVLARSWWAFISLYGASLYYFRASLIQAFQRRKALAWTLVLLTIFFLTVLLYLKFGDHLIQLYSGGNRFYWWQSAIRMFLAHPFTGVGSGAFATAYPYFSERGAQGTLYPHGLFLQILAGNGLLGLAALLFFIQQFISGLSPKGRSPSVPSYRALMATVLAVLCYSLININLEYFLNKFMLFIVLAALVRRSFHTTESYSLRIPWLIVGVATLVAMVPFWLSPLQASRLHVGSSFMETPLDEKARRIQLLSAVELDPYNGDLYAAIANSYRRQYEQFGGEENKHQWMMYLQTAYRWKKDIRYQLERAGSSAP
jgi:O-antigen ligase